MDMDMIDRSSVIENTIQELSKTRKSITREQIKEASGIDDPEEEIMDLIKKGIIMEVKPDDIRWV
jgi:hypothetical protein